MALLLACFLDPRHLSRRDEESSFCREVEGEEGQTEKQNGPAGGGEVKEVIRR